MSLRPGSDSRAWLSRVLAAVLVFIAQATLAYARAGGAGDDGGGGGGDYGGGGGDSGGGYDGGGGGGQLSPMTTLILIVILIVILVAQEAGKAKQSGESASGDEDEALPGPRMDVESIAAFRKAHPDFDPEAFRRKVVMSFMRIQAAWSAQDLSGARAFISDGTYQRFTTQFKMMQLLRQRNVLSRVEVLSTAPAAARADGDYDVLDVYVSARMHDAFISDLDHSLDTAGDGAFVEYWSYIRKRSVQAAKGDMYEASTCPACGAPLPKDMGEVCSCRYCHALVNSGEFDWVLAEITQQADYAGPAEAEPLESPNLDMEVAALRTAAPDFSVQLIEDKASNAFMQIMTAFATREMAVARRFVADAAFEQVRAQMPEAHVVFDRIYINEAALLAARPDGERHAAVVGIAATTQRVELRPGGGFTPLDGSPQRRSYVLTLERDAKAALGKGALYQHQCAACGGPVKDSLDLACPYCSTPLNSTSHEWIVTAFQTTQAYRAALARRPAAG